MMLFRSLIAPFERGLSPLCWIGTAISGALALGTILTNKSNRDRDRREWYGRQDDIRRRRSEAASQFNDRIAGLEGIDLGKVGAASYTPEAPPMGGGSAAGDLFALGAGAAYAMDQGQQPNQQGVGLDPSGQPTDYGQSFGASLESAGAGGAAAQAGSGLGIETPARRAASNPRFGPR